MVETGALPRAIKSGRMVALHCPNHILNNGTAAGVPLLQSRGRDYSIPKLALKEEVADRGGPSDFGEDQYEDHD